MKERNILYVHDLEGSKDSQTCKNIRELLPDCKVYAENFDLYDVKGTQEKIDSLIKEYKIDTLIGNSFGAFYVLARKAIPFRIVINPCMSPSQEIPELDKNIPDKVVKELFQLEKDTYGSAHYQQGNLTGGMAFTTFGIFSTDDELFSYSGFFSKNYALSNMDNRNMTFIRGGHHKLTKEELASALKKAFYFRNRILPENIREMQKNARRMKLFLVDRKAEMTTEWKKQFSNWKSSFFDVEIICSDFSDFMNEHAHEIDAIVAPANSYGLMDGGYDGAITAYFGPELMTQVQKYIIQNFYGEQPVASSFVIQIPQSTIRLIHTPSMRIPSKIQDPLTIYQCTRNSLICALDSGLQSIVLPAFGGHCGGIPVDKIAILMKKALEQIENPPEEINWEYAISSKLENYR